VDSYDVAVIGAGPAGCMAAKYAAKCGASALLLEEHKAIGWPVQCAGLLGHRALHESELCHGNFLRHSFRGAAVYSPAGSRLDFKAAFPRAWAVDRCLFDRALAEDALSCGAELMLGAAVRKMEEDERGGKVLHLGTGERIRSGVVISAEGVKARIARLAGIPPAQKILSGAQVEVPFQVDDPEKVEVHLGESPGLFAWVIPLSEDSARIGLCAANNACRFLRAFLDKDLIRKRLAGSSVAINAGGLPLGPPAFTAADGLIAVGDSAAQVKPTSGGGIYPGLLCAKIAGGVAAAATQEGDVSKERLSEYDRRWREALGRELEIGMRLNRILEKMGPEELDQVVDYLGRNPKLLKAIEEHGDIDRPSSLMARMLPHVGVEGFKFAGLLRHALR
jgi:digeranylgeranylglycerophospholipid reductase